MHSLGSGEWEQSDNLRPKRRELREDSTYLRRKLPGSLYWPLCWHLRRTLSSTTQEKVFQLRQSAKILKNIGWSRWKKPTTNTNVTMWPKYGLILKKTTQVSLVHSKCPFQNLFLSWLPWCRPSTCGCLHLLRHRDLWRLWEGCEGDNGIIGIFQQALCLHLFT